MTSPSTNPVTDAERLAMARVVLDDEHAQTSGSAGGLLWLHLMGGKTARLELPLIDRACLLQRRVDELERENHMLRHLLSMEQAEEEAISAHWTATMIRLCGVTAESIAPTDLNDGPNRVVDAAKASKESNPHPKIDGSTGVSSTGLQFGGEPRGVAQENAVPDIDSASCSPSVITDSLAAAGPAKPSKGRLTRNRARCKNCGFTIESRWRHEWVSCPCFRNEEGNRGIFIDGGLAYPAPRQGGYLENVEDLCEYEETP